MLSHHRLVYGEHQILLAPFSSGEGTATVVFEGRCRETITHKAIPDARVYVTLQGGENEMANGKCDAKGRYRILVHVTVAFDILHVDGQELTDLWAYPKQAMLKFDAPHFLSKTCVVDLDKGGQPYEVNADLQRKENGPIKLTGISTF